MRTPTGGTHVYFKNPDQVGNTTGSLFGPGIDTKCVGGYVVAPGSVRLEGTYEIVNDAAIAEIPERLRLAANKPKLTLPAKPIGTKPGNLAKRVSALLAKCPPAISGEGGHDRTLATACAVGPGFNLDPEEAYAWLVEYNTRCQPPWSEKELRHKVDDAYKVEPRRGWLLEEKRPQLKHLQQPVPAHTDADAPLADVIPINGGRVLLPGIFPDSISSIRTLINDHLGLLLGSAEPLRINDMSGAIEQGKKTFDIADLVTEIRIAAEDKIHYDTRKVDEITGRPIRAMLKLHNDDLKSVIVKQARANHYSPVQEWLQALPKVDPGAIAMASSEGLGITDELSLLLWRKWLIGCVARAMDPGCQLDTVLTLVAPKGGERKSSLFRALVGNEWFSDTYLDMVGPKRENAYMQLHSVWIYEVPELETASSRRERSMMKSFITSRFDKFRAPYDATVLPHPRAVALGATTNSLDFLSSNDTAFNRRFWPIKITGMLDDALVAGLRRQIWAEALSAFRSGEPWHLDGTLEASVLLLASRHEELAEEDAWAPIVQAYVSAPPRAKSALRLADIMRVALRMEMSKLNMSDQRRVGAILAGLGWVSRRRPWIKGAEKETRWVDGHHPDGVQTPYDGPDGARQNPQQSWHDK